MTPSNDQVVYWMIVNDDSYGAVGCEGLEATLGWEAAVAPRPFELAPAGSATAQGVYLSVSEAVGLV
jgi:hypothetical protein